MDVFQLIRKDHRKIRTLLDAVAGDFHQKRRQFAAAEQEIRTHMQAEDASLYDALGHAFLTVDEAARSRAEHDEITGLAARLSDNRLTEEEWMKLFFAFKDRTLDHMQMEEERVLPQARSLISEADSRRLATRMQREKSPQTDMMAALGLVPNLPQLPGRPKLTPPAKPTLGERHDFL